MEVVFSLEFRVLGFELGNEPRAEEPELKTLNFKHETQNNFKLITCFSHHL
jgi:hypothetical protein